MICFLLETVAPAHVEIMAADRARFAKASK
jgi:hypothetical protein